MISRGRRGALAIFFCLVLSATILLLLIFLKAAQERSCENDLSRAMRAQIQIQLAGYDRSWREFGLFGFRPALNDSAVFLAMLPPSMKNCRLSLEPQKPLTDSLILNSQIVRYMKARVPALYLSGLFKSLDLFHGEISESLQTAAMNEICSLSESDVKNAAGALFGGLLEKLQNEALLKIRETYRQYASEYMGSQPDSPAAPILGDMPDFLNPRSIARFAATAERLLDFKTAPIYENFCLVEYVLGQFKPAAIQMKTTAGAWSLKTVDGRSFNSFPSNREAEVEQILTGIGKPESALLAARALITGLRSIIHITAIIGDRERIETLRASATGISVFIGVLTSGQILIDPGVMTYLLAAGQAISAGMSDCEKLVNGFGVDLWPGKSALSINTYYQDYMRLFLLFIPPAAILERISGKLEQLLPGPCYASLQASVKYHNRTYRISGGYQ